MTTQAEIFAPHCENCFTREKILVILPGITFYEDALQKLMIEPQKGRFTHITDKGIIVALTFSELLKVRTMILRAEEVIQGLENSDDNFILSN